MLIKPTPDVQSRVGFSFAASAHHTQLPKLFGEHLGSKISFKFFFFLILILGISEFVKWCKGYPK